jgi:hypothetical protein
MQITGNLRPTVPVLKALNKHGVNIVWQFGMCLAKAFERTIRASRCVRITWPELKKERLSAAFTRPYFCRFFHACHLLGYG